MMQLNANLCLWSNSLLILGLPQHDIQFEHQCLKVHQQVDLEPKRWQNETACDDQ